jgi:hypothetical protein
LANINLREPFKAVDSGKTTYKLVCNNLGNPISIARTTVQSGEWIYFSARHLQNGSDHIKEVAAKLEGNDLIVWGSKTTTYVLENRKSKKKLKLTGQNQRLSIFSDIQEWWIIQDNVESIHRVIRFEFTPGVIA